MTSHPSNCQLPVQTCLFEVECLLIFMYQYSVWRGILTAFFTSCNDISMTHVNLILALVDFPIPHYVVAFLLFLLLCELNDFLIAFCFWLWHIGLAVSYHCCAYITTYLWTCCTHMPIIFQLIPSVPNVSK